MAASQPIALPNSSGQDYNDYPMQSVSPNTDFNPASYQRHFLGSPISWKMGSFGNRYIPSQSPTARFLNGFESVPVAKGSVESDRGSIINAFNVFNTEAAPGDYARNYSCCNLQLNDLHALLEHFEEVHIVRQPHYDQHNIDLAVPFNPVAYPQQPSQQQQQQQVVYNNNYNQQQPFAANNGFDPDDMDLGDEETTVPAQTYRLQQQPSSHSSPESGHSLTPPETPIISTPASAYSQPHAAAYPQTYQSYIPPHVYNPAPLKTSSSSLEGALGENPTLHPGSKPASPTKCVTPSLLFDQGPATAGPSTSSDFGGVQGVAAQRGSKSMPGTPLRSSPPPLPAGQQQAGGKKKQRVNNGVPTSLAEQPTTSNAPVLSIPAPGPSTAQQQTSQNSISSGPLANLSAATLATLTGLTSSKPFKCPKPNCNKSYKQANGLKYHMTHGSCVYTPPREVEQVRAIIGEHQRARMAANAEGGGIIGPDGQFQPNSAPESPSGLGHELGIMQPDGALQLSESELKELEREADKRLRPFACGVGDCSRRYKNMNGLRYHYQHSGDHGAIGLAMLANGTHDCISQNSADRHVERGRQRSGERGAPGVGGVRKERSKSKKHDGLGSASTSRAPSRNVSRVGTPVPAVPALPLALPQGGGPHQPPPQQIHQSTFPQNPPPTHTLTLQMGPLPNQPHHQQQNYIPQAQQQPQPQQPLSAGARTAHQPSPILLTAQMSQLGVHSAPASPLGMQYPQNTFQTASGNASHPTSPLGQTTFSAQQPQQLQFVPTDLSNLQQS